MRSRFSSTGNTSWVSLGTCGPTLNRTNKGDKNNEHGDEDDDSRAVDDRDALGEVQLAQKPMICLQASAHGALERRRCTRLLLQPIMHLAMYMVSVAFFANDSDPLVYGVVAQNKETAYSLSKTQKCQDFKEYSWRRS
ncbi:hypothetical protein AX14_013887 [Amanita brunnescens Koide BX004]|nr:hypothetical protein AX14_013887 [Amanita brunnescens Koide BX004]